MLNPTAPELLVDQKGRPYFLWDCDLTVDEFRARLEDPDPEVRAYWIGRTMRDAKPDDVFTFVSLPTIQEQWPRVERYLGRQGRFWAWLIDAWSGQRDGRG
jgi:hypothetical protein